MQKWHKNTPPPSPLGPAEFQAELHYFWTAELAMCMKFNRAVYIADVLWNAIAKSGLENQNGQNVPWNRIPKSSWENKQEKKKNLWKRLHQIHFEVKSVKWMHRFYKILIVFLPLSSASQWGDKEQAHVNIWLVSLSSLCHEPQCSPPTRRCCRMMSGHHMAQPGEGHAGKRVTMPCFLAPHTHGHHPHCNTDGRVLISSKFYAAGNTKTMTVIPACLYPGCWGEVARGRWLQFVAIWSLQTGHGEVIFWDWPI